jgi:GNAT superfamily N-acetyltransferase
MIEETGAAVNPQLATEDKGNAAQLRRGRGCIGPLVREGNFTLEDGTQIKGHVQTSRRPESVLEQPEEWNQHMLVCQRGCELLPVLTPPRVQDHLRTGAATTISFHVRGQEKAAGVLFMSPLKSIRGAKLEGYNVDGIAVQEGSRGQGIGTLLMQVAKEEAILAAAEEGREGEKTALSITVQEQLQRWVYPQGLTRNVEGRSVSWGANSTSFYWQPDDLYLDAAKEWKWTARGMINPDCLCQLVSVVQVPLGNDIFTNLKHLREATWPLWRAGDTLLRLMFRPHDPGIEDLPRKRFREIQDQRHLSKELIIRLYYVLRGMGGEEQDAQEMLSNLRTALDEEQTEQQPVFLQGTQPSWTTQLWGVEMGATRSCMTCQATRVMTTVREAEIRVMAAREDQILEYQVQQVSNGHSGGDGSQPLRMWPTDSVVYRDGHNTCRQPVVGAHQPEPR